MFSRFKLFLYYLVFPPEDPEMDKMSREASQRWNARLRENERARNSMDPMTASFVNTGKIFEPNSGKPVTKAGTLG